MISIWEIRRRMKLHEKLTQYLDEKENKSKEEDTRSIQEVYEDLGDEAYHESR